MWLNPGTLEDVDIPLTAPDTLAALQVDVGLSATGPWVTATNTGTAARILISTMPRQDGALVLPAGYNLVFVRPHGNPEQPVLGPITIYVPGG